MQANGVLGKFGTWNSRAAMQMCEPHKTLYHLYRKSAYRDLLYTDSSGLSSSLHAYFRMIKIIFK